MYILKKFVPQDDLSHKISICIYIYTLTDTHTNVHVYIYIHMYICNVCTHIYSSPATQKTDIDTDT